MDVKQTIFKYWKQKPKIIKTEKTEKKKRSSLLNNNSEIDEKIKGNLHSVGNEN